MKRLLEKVHCVARGLTRGHLVYAAGPEAEVTHTITTAGIEIVCHVLDLDQEPGPLLSRVRSLAKAIADPVLASD
ncbi:hypothetical protein [Actinomadura rupiterrae]|uniref:hypothetical protein n=1 Tax=Actinomadura rupiterrae TaxID=559627 RepID=UPI0020A2A74E|nr:hypothetical protein [Actinomadura rupiterrae]MCP2337359.1 hypothetical protein [Actinomadura rupiterrae]